MLAFINIATIRRLEIVKLKNLSALDRKLAAYDDDFWAAFTIYTSCPNVIIAELTWSRVKSEDVSIPTLWTATIKWRSVRLRVWRVAPCVGSSIQFPPYNWVAFRTGRKLKIRDVDYNKSQWYWKNRQSHINTDTNELCRFTDRHQDDARLLTQNSL